MSKIIDLGNNKESKRKLATIQKIKELKPIKDADKIELAIVNGWQCVVKKGEFNEGDRCVYIEIDSLLPLEEKYEFLRPSSHFKGNEYNREGFKLRTARLRGQISQGLALPLTIFKDKDLGKYNVGDDVSSELNIVKFIKPEMDSNFGKLKAGYSQHTSKTDELRVQSNPQFMEQLKGKPYIATVKAEGTSTTVEYDLKENKLKVYSRNSEYELEEDSGMYKLIHRLGLDKSLERLSKRDNKTYILKGELVGPKIMKNLLGLTQLDIRFFTLDEIDYNKVDKSTHGMMSERQSWYKLERLCQELGVNTVDVEEMGDSFKYTMEGLLDKAKGKYKDTDNLREGLVFRYLFKEDEDVSDELRNLSFKVINNDFLLKHKS